MQFYKHSLATMSFKRALLQVELLQQFFVPCAVNDTSQENASIICKYSLITTFWKLTIQVGGKQK